LLTLLLYVPGLTSYLPYFWTATRVPEQVDWANRFSCAEISITRHAAGWASVAKSDRSLCYHLRSC